MKSKKALQLKRNERC